MSDLNVPNTDQPLVKPAGEMVPLETTMRFKTLVNPNTGRKLKVKAWALNRANVVDYLRGGKTARDLSFEILGTKRSLETMENQEYGDSASNNFALSVFEHALDWRIGFTIIDFFAALRKVKKTFPNFELCVARNGDIFITAVGRKTGIDTVVFYPTKQD